MLHSCHIRIACFTLVLIVSGTRTVKKTRSTRYYFCGDDYDYNYEIMITEIMINTKTPFLYG